MSVLPKQKLQDLLGSTSFIGGVPESFLNPASIDMPLAAEAWRLESIFLPRPGCTVRSMFDEIGVIQHNLQNPLEVGVAYLILIKGDWSLPKSAYGYANPKSSSGRLNLFCLLMVDGEPTYDHMPEGWKGECWMLVRPDSFPIILSEGLAVAQIRIFDGRSFLSTTEVEIAVKRYGLLFDETCKKIGRNGLHTHADSIYLSLATGENFGFECRGSHKPLDFGRVSAYDPSDYFMP